VVVAESVLVDIRLEILRTDGMIDTSNTTFHQRPESLDAVGVDFPANVLFVMVSDSEVTEPISGHVVIGRELVSVENSVPANLVDCERYDGMPLNIANDLSDHLVISLSSSDNLRLALSSPATLAFSHTTHISLINLYLTRKMMEVLIKQGADLLEHSPGCLIGNAGLPLNLLGGYSASGRGHAIYYLEPDSKWGSGFVEDSSGSRVDLRAAIIAAIACAVLNSMVLGYLLTLHTVNTIGPTEVFKPFKTGIIIGELLFEVFGSVFLHLSVSFTLPFYHKIYLLSRDNYLKILLYQILYKRIEQPSAFPKVLFHF
jgi:hypothetical protein